MAQTTKEFFKGMSQIEICLSVFILQNTNRCINSIINEIPTTFLLMQMFEVTVIKKCMFSPTLVFIRFDITYTFVHSIISFSRNTGCTPVLYFYSKYWSHLQNISHTWGIFISNIFVSFTLLEGHCLYNSCVSIYFPIQGEE